MHPKVSKRTHRLRLGGVLLWAALGLRCASTPASTPASVPLGVAVLALEHDFESRHTTLEELEDGLQVRLPRFVAQATVVCAPQLRGEWSVGFVQAVRDLDLKMHYSSGAQSSWELPAQPVSDSDGDLPWYGPDAHVAACRGEHRLRLADALENRVTWVAPGLDGSGVALSTLIGYEREESFRVWLIALHAPTEQLRVLDAFDWEVRVDVEVRADAARGTRARVTRTQARRPRALPAGTDRRPPPQVLRAPTANEIQQLWWTDERGARTQLRGPVR